MQLHKLVFIIDDDVDDIEILTDFIHQIDKDIICRGYTDAKEVLETLRIPYPDYIFLDIRMPKMTGDVLLKNLRTIKNLDNAIIAVMSTTMNEKLFKMLKGDGANYVFEKPADMHLLSHLLREILTRS